MYIEQFKGLQFPIKWLSLTAKGKERNVTNVRFFFKNPINSQYVNNLLFIPFALCIHVYGRAV